MVLWATRSISCCSDGPEPNAREHGPYSRPRRFGHSSCKAGFAMQHRDSAACPRPQSDNRRPRPGRHPEAHLCSSDCPRRLARSPKPFGTRGPSFPTQNKCRRPYCGLGPGLPIEPSKTHTRLANPHKPHSRKFRQSFESDDHPDPMEVLEAPRPLLGPEARQPGLRSSSLSLQVRSIEPSLALRLLPVDQYIAEPLSLLRRYLSGCSLQSIPKHRHS